MARFTRRLQQAAAKRSLSSPATGPSPAYWSQWSNGFPTDPAWFPIAAWQPNITSNYGGIIPPYADLGAGLADAGVNVIDGTWDWLDTVGPSYVNRAIALDMKVIATGPDMSYLQRNPSHASAIIGWQTGDEFEMFRVNDGAPYGPNSPTTIHAAYVANRTQDTTRPQHINWGKPMGGWYYSASGGYDTGSAEGDLKLYQESCDLSSVDYYWWTDPWENKPNAFGYGVSVDAQRHYARLDRVDKPLWMFVENSRPWDITSPAITADQMEAAVWNSIVHGARGIIYFIHDFGGGASGAAAERGVWSAGYYDRTMGDAIIARMKTVNARLKSLAPVLNSPEIGTIHPTTGREQHAAFVTVSSSTSGVPIDVMVRQYAGKTYIFAQASGSASRLASAATTGTFTWHQTLTKTLTVRDEARTVAMTNGVWTDSFAPYQLHIYELS